MKWTPLDEHGELEALEVLSMSRDGTPFKGVAPKGCFVRQRAYMADSVEAPYRPTFVPASVPVWVPGVTLAELRGAGEAEAKGEVEGELGGDSPQPCEAREIFIDGTWRPLMTRKMKLERTR